LRRRFRTIDQAKYHKQTNKYSNILNNHNPSLSPH
jgi:hypothetical protein